MIKVLLEVDAEINKTQPPSTNTNKTPLKGPIIILQDTVVKYNSSVKQYIEIPTTLKDQEAYKECFGKADTLLVSRNKPTISKLLIRARLN